MARYSERDVVNMAASVVGVVGVAGVGEYGRGVACAAW